MVQKIEGEQRTGLVQIQPAFQSARTFAIGGFVLLLAAILLYGVWGKRRIPTADATDVALVARGQQVYASNCASCHGAQLEGQPNWQQDLPTGGRPAPPHDATGHTWHHNDRSLFTTVKFGGQATAPPGVKSNMPALGGSLSDEEIWAVLAYIKSTWPPEVQAAQRLAHE